MAVRVDHPFLKALCLYYGRLLIVTLEGLPRLSSAKQAVGDRSHEAEIKERHAKSGELTIEKDIVSKARAKPQTLDSLAA